MLIFPHSPMLTIYLDGQVVKGFFDMCANTTILTKTEVLHFPHWKFNLLPISGVGGQQDSKMTSYLVHWNDLNGNWGAIHPIISTVPKNMWDRDILEDRGDLLTTDDRA